MPPQLALAFTVLFIGYVFLRDSREEPRASNAVWIPVLWLLISGSRQVSQWLQSGPLLSSQTLSDGSPLDKAVFGALIVAGVSVLATRQTRVKEILTNNPAFLLFLLYEGLSVVWSDNPLTALRRFVKAVGDPVMVLVLWSDPAPARAVTATIKRCGFLLIPLSILFCKYYENWGRTFDTWGTASYTGVTMDKNMFGYLLFAFGLFFFSSLLSTRSDSETRKLTRIDQIIYVLLLGMIVWLFPIANSKTALVSACVGLAVIVALRISTIRRHFWAYTMVAIPLAFALNTMISLQGTVAEAAGRDATFTGRTGLWETVLQEPINPLIGEGYASFWLGERLQRFWAMYPTSPPIQAHNGYIEVYLNLGLIGLFLIAIVLATGLRKMRKRVTDSLTAPGPLHERVLTTFGLAYGVAYLFYNVTEATFQGVNFLFIIFLMLALESRQTNEPAKRLSRPVPTTRWRPVPATRWNGPLGSRPASQTQRSR
jgi:exopolysaccharide production protein ExoQ